MECQVEPEAHVGVVSNAFLVDIGHCHRDNNGKGHEPVDDVPNRNNVDQILVERIKHEVEQHADGDNAKNQSKRIS